MQLLLQHGAKVNAVDGEDLTPAMWACHFDQSANLNLLQTALARTDPRDGALFEDTDIFGQTAIHWAVNKTGSMECLKVSDSEKFGETVAVSRLRVSETH